MGPRRRAKGWGSKQIGRVLDHEGFQQVRQSARGAPDRNYKATLTKYRAGRSENKPSREDLTDRSDSQIAEDPESVSTAQGC